jgi:hypothetical protein
MAAEAGVVSFELARDENFVGLRADDEESGEEPLWMAAP